MEKNILTGKKVLIVEDDPSSKLYLNKIMERTGAGLLNAGDGKEAVDLVIDNPDIDAVLMDLQLPVMDGYTAAKKIKELRKEIVIIAQTAYGLFSDQKKILDSGFDDFIIKPIYSQVLIDKLVSNLFKNQPSV